MVQIETSEVEVDGIAELNRQYAQHWVTEFQRFLGDDYHLPDDELQRLHSAVEKTSAAGIAMEDRPSGYAIGIKLGFTVGLKPVDFIISDFERRVQRQGSAPTPMIPLVPHGQDVELRRRVAANHNIDIDGWDRVVPPSTGRSRSGRTATSPVSTLGTTTQNGATSWPSEWDRNDSLEP